MVDLKGTSGLPLQLKDDGTLVFGDSVLAVEPAVRTLDAMREVLVDPRASGPAVLYYMYRNVGRPEEKAKTEPRALRYDITIIPPAKLGSEWTKTYGHYHPRTAKGPYYPEVYEVLSGRAIYLLQRRDAQGRIDDVLVIPAGPGEKVFMLPGYGHATINVGDAPLAMANWVAGSFSSEYGDYKERHGAAYYALVEGDGVRWEPNPHYGNLPKPRFVSAVSHEATTGLRAGAPMYPAVVADPSRYDYIVDPSLYRGEWSALVR